jgi:hypothetical protein
MTEELQRQLEAVRAMGDGNDATRSTALARRKRLEELGDQRWKYTERDEHVENLCQACGYTFGDESNLYEEGSVCGRMVLALREKQQTMHDEICRSGLYMY